MSLRATASTTMDDCVVVGMGIPKPARLYKCDQCYRSFDEHEIKLAPLPEENVSESPGFL